MEGNEEKDFNTNWYEWWERLQPLVNKFTRETFLAGLEREDLRQECFLQLQKALLSYDAELGVSFPYYYKVVLYGWRANKNRKNKTYAMPYEDEALRFIKDETVNVALEAERGVLFERLKERIEELDEIERQIIVAYYFEGKSLKEVARGLKLSYKKIENNKRRGLERLKKLIE